MKKYTMTLARLLILGILVVPISMKAQTDHDGAFVYTLGNASGPNIVDAYQQDRESGKLTFLGAYPTGGLGSIAGLGASQHPLISQGHFLYAANSGSNDISVFRIQEDGTLRLLHSPFPSGGIAPLSLALHDHLLYAANLGNAVTPPNYTGFRVRDGFLRPLPDSTISLNIGDHPSDVVFNRRGNLLAGSRAIANIVDAFRVDDSGRLNHTGQMNNQLGVIGLSFSPTSDDQVFGGITDLPGASSYSMSSDGSISLVSTVVDVPAVDTCWEVIDKTGRQGWFVAPISGTITLFSIDQNGALTKVSPHATIGITPTEVVLSTSEKFMYVTEPFSNAIEQLQLTGTQSDGGLVSIETVNIPDSSFSAIGLVFVDLKK